MKTIRLAGSIAPAIFAIALTSACTAETKMPSEREITDMAAKYTAAWCSQNPASVASYYEEKGSLKINTGLPAVGRGAITEAARAFMTSLPDMIVKMDSVRVKGSSAVYHWTLTGTNTGPGGTGKAIHISGYEEWKFGAAGLIEQSLGHYDAVEYARQLREGVARE